MPKTERILVRTQEERATEASSMHEGSTVLTFEKEEDNLATPDSFGFPQDPNAE